MIKENKNTFNIDAMQFDALQEILLSYLSMLEYNGEYDNNKEAQQLIKEIRNAVYFGNYKYQKQPNKYLEQLLEKTQNFIENN